MLRLDSLQGKRLNSFSPISTVKESLTIYFGPLYAKDYKNSILWFFKRKPKFIHIFANSFEQKNRWFLQLVTSSRMPKLFSQNLFFSQPCSRKNGSSYLRTKLPRKTPPLLRRFPSSVYNGPCSVLHSVHFRLHFFAIWRTKKLCTLAEFPTSKFKI